MGAKLDIVEYCHEKGLGAAHTSFPKDLDPAAMRKIRDQIGRYDMRLTVGLRTPRTDAEWLLMLIERAWILARAYGSKKPMLEAAEFFVGSIERRADGAASED